MPADVLILTTRPDSGATWRSDLATQGYSVTVGELQTPAWLGEAERALVSVLVLDVPHLSVVELQDLKRLRCTDGRTPFVVIIGEGDIVAKVRALEAGADLCLTPDASGPEVVARVSSLLRRVPFGSRGMTISEGDLSLDLLQGSAIYGGRKLDLSPYEFRVIKDLALGVMECRARFARSSGDDRLTEALRRLRAFAEEVEHETKPLHHQHRFPRQN